MSQKHTAHNFNMLIIYWSATGNTEKVAAAIHDLVFLGTPSYRWQPPAPVQEYIKAKMDYYRKRGSIKLCAPKVPGKKAVVFVTYSNPHSGINEAIPVGKYCKQFFEHLRFDLVGEWYVVGEFHGSEEHSTKGRLGDIRGRPNQQDLDEVENNVLTLIISILPK